jgi:tetratricopeptide (TPR) repeat protein/class 3 adenylate cyclase
MKNLIPHFIAEKFAEKVFQGQFPAAALFMDISGFTAMTQRLMEEGKEGAEILVNIINTVFEPVIAAVYQSGGFISTFAGDAFTAIFPDAEKSDNAIVCAIRINKIFQEIGRQKTRLGEFELNVKIGISFGNAEWEIIGTDSHKAYYFRGDAVDGCAFAEHHCQINEIVLDEAAARHASAPITEALIPIDSFYKLKEYKEIGDIKSPPVGTEEVPDEILRYFLPDAVIQQKVKGEFREVASIFISYRPMEMAELKPILLEAIALSDRFGGFWESIDFGDKGANSLVLFGVPKRYEKNLERALDFALAMRDKFQDKIRIGITQGLVFSGFKGSDLRGSYGVLGNTINLSARLMMKAAFGELITPQSLSNQKDYEFNLHGEYHFKGISGALKTYRLLDKKKTGALPLFSGKMQGRAEELKKLQNLSAPLKKKKFAGIVTVYGEAGMGKSRLVYEFTKKQKGRGLCFLQTDNILKISMNPFKYFLQSYFQQLDLKDGTEKKRNFERIFEKLQADLSQTEDRRVNEILFELKRLKSILAAQLDIFYEQSLYHQLDPKGRFENTLFAYKALFKALSLMEPIVIQVEDIQWLDDDSQQLFRTLCRNIEDYPMMIVATSRFNDDGSKPKIEADKTLIQHEIILQQLEEAAANAFIEAQLKGKAAESLLEQINRKTEYNPFYIEQFISYLKENNLLRLENDHHQILETETAIPNTINGIIIARIDRLESELKNIVQIASVLGREVELQLLLALLEIYDASHKEKEIHAYLKEIEKDQIWSNLREIKYIFKHALLHEAVYEMQLKARIRELHTLAAQLIIDIYGDSEDKFFEIANHFDKAENGEQAALYYKKAGDYYQNNYHNVKAIECFQRYLFYAESVGVNQSDLATIHRKMGHIFQLIGKWDEAENVFRKSVELAKETHDENLLAECESDYGIIRLFRGDNQQAMEILNAVKKRAVKTNNKRLQSKVVCPIGIVYSYQGDSEKAMACFEEDRDICLELGDKREYAIANSNIGSVHLSRGEYAKAMACFTVQKEISQELGDRRAYSIAMGNMGVAYVEQGDYSNGMACYEERKQTSLELGDKRGYSIALSNMGNVYKNLGDYHKAMACYQEQKEISQELGDRRALATIAGSIGNVYINQGHYSKALACYEEQKQIALELGDKRSYSIAAANLGGLSFDQGDFSKAQSYYDERKKISLEMGDKRGYSMALTDLGAVFYHQGEYEQAMECYEEAIAVGRDLKIPFDLCQSLYGKAYLLYFLEDYNSSKITNDEAKSMANDVQRKEIIFNCTILENKLLALENPKEATRNLNTLLETETEEEKRATIYFEMYQINQLADDRQKAHHLYQKLFEKIPKFEYQKKIQELDIH